jgi:hypothetical protein
VQWNYTALVQLAVAGSLPAEFAPYIAGAPLMALIKKCKGVRPIAMGEVLRRVASKCCCKLVVEDAKVFFGPYQVGVATSGATEAPVHVVREMARSYGNDPGIIMLKVDFSNAFNNIERQNILERTWIHFPGIYCWVLYCYGQPGMLYFAGIIIASKQGVQQGDPLGPLLFSLVLHELVLEIAVACPELKVHVWYLDDGTLIGTYAEVQKALAIIRLSGPRIGMVLNETKNELWWPSQPDTDDDGFPVGFKRRDNEGVDLLGAPIGTEEFCTRYLVEKLKKLDLVDTRLLMMKDAQVEMLLLRYCLSIGKLTNLVRATPPALVSQALALFDDRMFRMLARVMRVTGFDEVQWAQAGLPIRSGGVGLTQALQLSGAAYVASCALTHNLTAKILQLLPADYTPQYVDDLCAAHEAATGSATSYRLLIGTDKVQKKLMDEVHASTLRRLLAPEQPARLRARLRGIAMENASDFMHAAPVPGQRIKHRHMVVALQHRLGCKLMERPLECPRCFGVMDVLGDHAWSCSSTASRISTHENCKAALGELAEQAGHSVTYEPCGILRDSGAKPGDFVLKTFDRDFPESAFDISVRATLQPSSLHSAALTSGVFCRNGHQVKMRKYAAECAANHMGFRPLAIESTGGFTKEAREMVDIWSDQGALRSGKKAELIKGSFYRKFSVALQTANARTITDRVPLFVCPYGPD